MVKFTNRKTVKRFALYQCDCYTCKELPYYERTWVLRDHAAMPRNYYNLVVNQSAGIKSIDTILGLR